MNQAYAELLDETINNIAKLDIRERKILCLYFGLFGERKHTLAELSTEFGRTRERISQIVISATKSLKQMHEDELDFEEPQRVIDRQQRNANRIKIDTSVGKLKKIIPNDEEPICIPVAEPCSSEESRRFYDELESQSLPWFKYLNEMQSYNYV